MKKIAILITSIAFGGAEAQACLLASKLADRGYTVRVFVILDSPEERTLNKKVQIVRLGMGKSIFRPLKIMNLVRLLNSFAPDVLLTFNYPATILGRFIRPLVLVPRIITSFRGNRFKNSLRYSIIRLTNQLDDFIVVNSENSRRRFIEQNLFSEKRSGVIYNAFDFSAASSGDVNKTAMRASLGVGEDQFLWVAAGRIDASKDYDNLIDAAAVLQRSCAGKKIALRIAGPGTADEFDFFRQRIRAAGLEQLVRFIGLRRDLPQILASADAFVLSSVWEGLPNVLIEAHAAGLPVVATRVGGVDEIVQDQISGFLVPSRNPDELGRAMSAMTNADRSRRHEMGQAGLKYVRKLFASEEIIEAWERLLVGGLCR